MLKSLFSLQYKQTFWGLVINIIFNAPIILVLLNSPD